MLTWYSDGYFAFAMVSAWPMARAAASRVYFSLASTRVPAADSMPPMPFTSDSRGPGT